MYEALRLRGLRTASGETTFPQGAPIDFEFRLVNRSSSPVTLPLVNDGEGTRYYASGTLQTWIERLGPDPDTDCLPGASRKDTWYATGGWVNMSSSPVTIPPGGDTGTALQASLSAGTDQLPAAGQLPVPRGDGRADGYDEAGVIDHRTIDVTITGTEVSTPAPTPTWTPWPSPTPWPTATPAPTMGPRPDPSPAPSSPAPAAS